MKLISIVTPMYNEEASCDDYFINLSRATEEISRKFDVSFEIITVNDGSKDGTLEKLKSWHELQDNLTVINLSRNFGQEPAVFAGLEKTSGDAVIVMDCDMQDPPSLIELMVEKYLEGFDVVNARRVKRAGDTLFKRRTAGLYYKLLNKLSYKVKYPENVNNFRLVSRKVLNIILSFPEQNKHYRGLVPFAGFKSCEIEFERKDRLKGKSKYNLRAMLRLAVDGVTAASIKPLFYCPVFGIIFTALGAAGLALIFILYLLGVSLNYTLFAALSGLSFFSGVILVFTGILSIYTAKVFEEVKHRPFSITESVLEKRKRFQ